MGRKKRMKKIIKRPKQTVRKTFNCPYCSYPDGLHVKIDRRLGKAILYCKKCSVTFQTECKRIEEEVDVYCGFLDQCIGENANNKI